MQPHTVHWVPGKMFGIAGSQYELVVAAVPLCCVAGSQRASKDAVRVAAELGAQEASVEPGSAATGMSCLKLQTSCGLPITNEELPNTCLLPIAVLKLHDPCTGISHTCLHGNMHTTAVLLMLWPICG